MIDTIECPTESLEAHVRTAVCVLCGCFGPVTKEHVPPKNLFLKPRPVNMITVNLCEPCNGGYAKDDEFFRIQIAMGAEPGTKLWELWKDKVLGSTFARSPALRVKLLQDRSEFLERHRNKPIRLSDGSFVPDELRSSIQPMNAKRINSVVEKMVRCLHVHNFQERLPVETSFTITTAPLCEADAFLLANHPTGSVGHNEEFRYFTMALANDMAWWVLKFYEKHSFTILVTLPSSAGYYPRRNY